jgi:chorismate-pyruvate lyase
LALPIHASEKTTYTYDPLGRLTKTVSDDGPLAGQQASTSYDPAGNRLTHSVTGVTVTLSVGNASATEGAAMVFTVTKTGTASGSVNVNYATANGSAAAGSDYTAASGTLTFLQTETSKTVSVATTNDTAVESAETFTLALSNPTGGAVLGSSPGTGTINDNDVPPPPPSFAIANAAAVTEGGTLAFAVTKTGTTSSSFSVNYATANGTAAAGSDYTAGSGTLTFLAAETSKTVNVATINDTSVESAETVLVNLSAPTGGATITDSQGSGTINDNDVPPPPSFAIANAAPVAEGGTLSFTVTKTGSTASSFSVNYVTANGTAIAGSDYTSASGTLTFLAAETSKTVSVATIDDTAVEPDETMLVNLSGPTGGATVTTSQGSGTIQNNDAANASPVANNDSLSMQVCRTTTKNVTANDTDPEGDLPLTVIDVNAASSNIGVSIASASSVQVESFETTGSYAVTYTIQDSRGATDSGNLQVTVTAGVCQ